MYPWNAQNQEETINWELNTGIEFCVGFRWVSGQHTSGIDQSLKTELIFEPQPKNFGQEVNYTLKKVDCPLKWKVYIGTRFSIWNCTSCSEATKSQLQWEK